MSWSGSFLGPSWALTFDTNHFTVSLASVVFSIFIAAVLAWQFNLSVTRRLSILVDNTQRLVKEIQLHPPVGGSDEIAMLDRIFAEMASKLSLSYETEKAILATVPIGIALLDQQGLIRFANPSLSAMFHVGGQLIGTKFVDLVGSVCSDLAAASSQPSLDTTIQTSGGARLHLSISIKPLRAQDIDGYLAVVMDVTRRKELDILKQDYVSMVSHDLRTPLTSVRLFVGMFEKGALGELSDEWISTARQADRCLDQLNALVNDILDLEKLESGAFKLDLESLELSKLIEDCLKSKQIEADGKNIQFRVQLQRALVMADANQIARTLGNLLDNAMEVSPPGSFVEIDMATQPDSVLVQVRDKGQPVPPRLQETIFQRFKQTTADNNIINGTSSFALAVCKSLITAHSGEIGLRSEEERGNTIWFSLPLSNSQPT